jgi:hypothetical protein
MSDKLEIRREFSEPAAPFEMSACTVPRMQVPRLKLERGQQFGTQEKNHFEARIPSRPKLNPDADFY